MSAVLKFINEAVELSIFAAPEAPGLTAAEIVEAGSRFEFHEGEIRDCLAGYGSHFTVRQGRLVPASLHEITNFFDLNEPEYRDPKAFEFVNVELRELGRRVGAAAAISDRNTLVARGVAAGLDERALQIAVTTYLLAGYLVGEAGGLRLAPGRENYALPSKQMTADTPRPRPGVEQVMAAVTDVVRRRTDKRPAAAEPTKAFELELDSLGYGRFRVWWSATVQELHLADLRQPLSVCVLAAALAEGALTFVVKRARDLKLGTMGSRTFDGPPRTWRFEDLLGSAAAGGPDAIFDEDTRRRAKRLNDIRQRIHAGRLLEEIPSGPIPDLRPEEARESLQALDQILRRVLDWITAHPEPARQPSG